MNFQHWIILHNVIVAVVCIMLSASVLLRDGCICGFKHFLVLTVIREIFRLLTIFLLEIAKTFRFTDKDI